MHKGGKLTYPNLFIIGAPKCGTTSLYAHLRQHPQVFLTEPKEPNHFAYAFGNPYNWPSHNPYRNREDYLSLFQSTGSAAYVGEASTCYSLMPHVASAIREFAPDAKIIALLREPVQRAWSMYLFWHQFNPRCQHIDIDDFRQRFLADDLVTEHDRLQSQSVKWLRGAGMYWENLRHYYYNFPSDQILLLQYDSFMTQPQTTLDRVCQFLGIEDFRINPHLRENKTAVPKFRGLYNFINNDASHPLRVFAKQIIGRFVSPQLIKRIANRLLLQIESRRTLPAALIQELSAYYNDDLQCLMASTGFDTRPWLKAVVPVDNLANNSHQCCN